MNITGDLTVWSKSKWGVSGAFTKNPQGMTSGLSASDDTGAVGYNFDASRTWTGEKNK